MSDRPCGLMVAVLCMLLAAGAVEAQEPSREIAGGGLWLVNDPAIAFHGKDLVISETEIRATYVLRNTARTARTIVMAFPLPEIDMASLGDQTAHLAAPQSDNFVAATIAADGQPVAGEIEQRAYAVGLDVTRHLEEAGIPLFPMQKRIGDRLGRLEPAVRRDLGQRGIVRIDDDRVAPNWLLRTVVHWRQTFGPGQSVSVQLAYRPVVAEARFSAEALESVRGTHCVDVAIEADITRLVAAKGGQVTLRWLTYSLTAGSHLFGEIGQFRLALEKSHIHDIIATCRKGLRQPGPRVLEWSAQAFHPDDDVHVLFVR